MRPLALTFIALLGAFLLGGLPLAVFAQEGPGSFARFTHRNGGIVLLDANFVASNTCQAALDAYRGAPPGRPVGNFVIPVTIVIGPDPRGCGQSRVVRRNVTVGAASLNDLIEIYFVSPSGRILKIEKVAIATF